MKTYSGALLVALSGKKITEDTINNIFNSVGITKKMMKLKVLSKL